MNEFERTFSEIESLFADPILGKIISDAKEVNEIVSAQPITHAESVQLVEDLNAQWRAGDFYNKKMYVTGEVFIGGNFHNVDYIEQDGEGSKNEHTPLRFQGHGFSMRNTSVMTPDGMTVTQQLLLRGRTEVKSKGDVEGVSNEECGIVLASDTIIECREKTPAKVAAWLDVYNPDVKAEIDYSIMEADNEASATLALRELVISIEGHGKKDVKQQKTYIEAYLNAVNKYEQHVPYAVELLGECQILGDGGFHNRIITSENTTFVLLSELFLEENTETQQLKPWVRGSLIGTDKQKIEAIRMPLETIMAIESTRDAYRK